MLLIAVVSGIMSAPMIFSPPVMARPVMTTTQAVARPVMTTTQAVAPRPPVTTPVVTTQAVAPRPVQATKVPDKTPIIVHFRRRPYRAWTPNTLSCVDGYINPQRLYGTICPPLAPFAP